MNNIIVIVSLLAFWPFSSAKEFSMRAGKNVPAATGMVKAQKDKDNGNTKLEIKVEHLANPSSLTPPAAVYIVWVRPQGATEALKQGAIRVDKDLRAELKVVTVSKDFEVFITAEQSDGASAPSDAQVLSTHVSLR